MAGTYRIFGSELSPYSIKVRSYFRYKEIPHEWVIRSMDKMPEFQKYAKLPLIPLVVTPEGQGIQDSTPIIEKFEKQFPEPSIHPADATLKFLSELIEEYADEWCNKPMFHYRWFYEPDQASAALRIARDQSGMKEGSPNLAPMAEMIKKRMVPRLSFVGSSKETASVIEGSYERQLAILEKHLAGGRPYLFGKRPALADFGLYAQLYQCWSDPTPGAILRKKAPRVEAWTQRMLDPKAEGTFETWDDLKETLLPLLKEEVGAVFLPWSVANARALAAGEKEFAMLLSGRPFKQETQKYHAKSLGEIRRKYLALPDRKTLDPILKETGCLPWLSGG